MLAQGVFEASQSPLRTSAHPALRIARAQRLSKQKIVKQKIANFEVPHCAGTSRFCLVKSAHCFGRRTLAKCIIGKTGLLKTDLLKNRIPLLIVFPALSRLSVSAVSAVVFDSSNP